MMPLLFAIALIYKLYTGNNAFNNNVIFIAFVIYMLIIIPLIIILTLIGSICPHCYKFQSLNGGAVLELKEVLSSYLKEFLHSFIIVLDVVHLYQKKRLMRYTGNMIGNHT